MLLCLVRLMWKLVGFWDHMLGAGPHHLFGVTRVINKLCLCPVGAHSSSNSSKCFLRLAFQFEQFHRFLGSTKLFLCKGNPSLLHPTYI